MRLFRSYTIDVSRPQKPKQSLVSSCFQTQVITFPWALQPLISPFGLDAWSDFFFFPLRIGLGFVITKFAFVSAHVKIFDFGFPVCHP